jgi:hypothetical protein
MWAPFYSRLGPLLWWAALILWLEGVWLLWH